MKKLPLSSPAFQYVEKSFGEWLDVLGYVAHTVKNMPIQIRELLHGLEQQGITGVERIEAKHFVEHYQRLQLRMNERDGGALNAATLNKHRQALVLFAQYLRKMARQALPHIELQALAIEDKALEVLTVEQMRTLFAITSEPSDQAGSMAKWSEAIAQRDRVLLVIFYGCGLRRNEGYHLDVGDMDLDRKCVHVRKGKAKKERFVPFNDTNARYLSEYMHEGRLQLIRSKTEGALFVTVHGKRQSTESMVVRLQEIQRRSDDERMKERPITLHGLRHSIATHLLQGGMSLEKIARFLGHSSLESTQIYTHLSAEAVGEGGLAEEAHGNVQ